jgi:hypothetical protein
MLCAFHSCILSHSDTRPFSFWWDWGLNSELHTCKAGVLSLQSHLQSILPLVILEIGGSQELFAKTGLEP